ncbi:MAG: hypothetical protein V2A34_10835, partial [Lentisphaerota bacterium]
MRTLFTYIHPARHVVFLLFLAVMGWMGPDAHATTLNWAGKTWTVKQGGPKGPGPNYWSATTNCVWVDVNGYLHLKTKYFSNHWYCAEIYTEERYPYGEYRMQVESAVTNLDTNIVFGFFLYQNEEFHYPLNIGIPEIDIEFARQFKDMGPGHNTSFGVQQTIVEGQRVPTNSCYFFTSNTVDKLTTHRFVWTHENLFFQTYTGHGAPGSGSIMAQWTRSSNAVYGIPSDNMKLSLHLNCYAFLGRAPQRPQDTEIIIRGITTPAAIQPHPTATNLLEGFEDGMTTNGVAGASTNLYTFESGATNGWGRRTWWADCGNLVSFTSAAHSGSTAMRYLTDGQSGPNVCTNSPVPVTNWLAFNNGYLRFWSRINSTNITLAHDGLTHSVRVQFRDKDMDRWEASSSFALSTNWQQCEVKLTRTPGDAYNSYGFVRCNNADDGDNGLGNYTWDLTNSAEVRFVFTDPLANGYHNHDFFVDDVSLAMPPTVTTNIDWHIGSWQSTYLSVSFQTNTIHSSTNAVMASQTDYNPRPEGTNIYNVIWTTNLSIRNWTNYNKIAFWAKRTQTQSSSNHWIKIQFIQADGGMWVMKDPAPLLTTNWTHYVANLDTTAFEKYPWDGTNPSPPPNPPGDLDITTGMTNIHAIRFVLCNTWTN